MILIWVLMVEQTQHLGVTKAKRAILACFNDRALSKPDDVTRQWNGL